MIEKLGNIATYLNGYAFKPCDWSESGLPIIRIQDLTGTSAKPNYYEKTYDKKYEINEGDVLISWSASLGVYVWHGRKALLNQHIFKVIFDKIVVDKDFFVYQVEYILKKATALVHGATMQHLTRPVFNNLPFKLFPIERQQKIALTLNTISTLINDRQKQLQYLDGLIKSRFVEMFEASSTDIYNLSEVADIVSGITKGRKLINTPLYEVPYMAVSNVKSGYIDWSTVKTIKASKTEINQYRLKPNDILMTEGGDPDKVGRGAIIKNPPIDCIHQNHIFRVRLNSNRVSPEYFEEYLQSPIARRYFLRAAKQTTGIASINMKQLKNLPVKIPAITLQNQFAAFVQQVDKSRLAVQKSLDELDLLKKSLMQEYFG